MPIHLRAEHGAYAEACLLPGDPLRAKYIAETFFDDPVEVNTYRGLLGYTGTFGGKPVSVQTSGMGCPAAAIVIEELVQLGVKKILRVGTCGGLRADVMGELIVALAAAPADKTALEYVGNEPFVPTASFEIVHELVHQAKELGRTVRVGPIVSSAVFYQPDQGQARRWAERGILAVEMEAAGLYGVAAEHGARALAICTVSDHIKTGDWTTSEERESTFDEMVRIALETIRLDLG